MKDLQLKCATVVSTSDSSTTFANVETVNQTLASTARGYFAADVWCFTTPSYNHARRTWRVPALNLILTWICLEQPSGAGGKLTIILIPVVNGRGAGAGAGAGTRLGGGSRRRLRIQSAVWHCRPCGHRASYGLCRTSRWAATGVIMCPFEGDSTRTGNFMRGDVTASTYLGPLSRGSLVSCLIDICPLLGTQLAGTCVFVLFEGLVIHHYR
eukprot:2486181-Pleurochrysis_carterae.AAC.12